MAHKYKLCIDVIWIKITKKKQLFYKAVQTAIWLVSLTEENIVLESYLHNKQEFIIRSSQLAFER